MKHEYYEFEDENLPERRYICELSGNNYQILYWGNCTDKGNIWVQMTGGYTLDTESKTIKLIRNYGPEDLFVRLM